jgi:hypothetical protein
MGLVVLFGVVLLLIESLGGGAGAIQESLDATSYATANGKGDAPASLPAETKVDGSGEPKPDLAEDA